MIHSQHHQLYCKYHQQAYEKHHHKLVLDYFLPHLIIIITEQEDWKFVLVTNEALFFFRISVEEWVQILLTYAHCIILL